MPAHARAPARVALDASAAGIAAAWHSRRAAGIPRRMRTCHPHDHDDALQRLDAHYRPCRRSRRCSWRIAGYDGHRLRLHAPLAAHVNDKGCAFGGSLASLMTLAGVGAGVAALEAAGLEADMFVADSQVRYLAPLFADLESEAELAPEADWRGFLATLRERGRARIGLVARARLPDGGSPPSSPRATWRSRNPDRAG